MPWRAPFSVIAWYRIESKEYVDGVNKTRGKHLSGLTWLVYVCVYVYVYVCVCVCEWVYKRMPHVGPID